MLLKLYGGQQFNPLVHSPALWLDASDIATLVMDGARTFNGSTQYLTCANNSTLQTGDVDFWISVWCYKSSSTTSGIITKNVGTTGVGEWELSYSTGLPGIYFIVRDGTTATVVAQVTKTSVPDATWFHLFAYHDSINDVVKLSYNGGAFLSSSSYTGTPSVGTSRLTLGAYSDNNYKWPGNLDSAAFGKPTAGWLASNATALRDYLYNGGSGRRSSDFLASAYYTGGNPSGAVSWWDMDARSGNETDRIGSNHLTDNGGVGYAAGVASGLVQYTGDPVKQWSDKSGNARHVTAASDAGRPTYVTGVTNGLPGISFDGTDDYLFIASTLAAVPFWIATANIINDTDGTAVSLWVSDTAYARVGNVASGADYPAAQMRVSSSFPVARAVGNNNVLQIEIAKFTSDSYRSIRTNLGNTAEDTTTVTLGTPTRIFLGKSRNGDLTGALTGTLLEVLVGTSELSDAQVVALIRYLGNKWGITVA